MGYYLYLSEDHNVIVSRHIIFLEKEFISKMEIVGERLSSKRKSLKSIEFKNLNSVISQ